MGFFSDILDKLGLPSAQTDPVPAPTELPPAGEQSPGAPVPVDAPAVASITMLDVVAKLEQLAAANPQKLNWRTSIVDLLKLLDMDSSLAARKELAKELYCPDELLDDSAQMNMWLHKNVMANIAANGGNLPPDLLN